MVNQMWVTNTIPNNVSNQINWSTPIMPMAGTGGTTTLQGPPIATGPRINFRNKSRFMKKLFSCPSGTMPEKHGDYYRIQSLDKLLPAMDFNPLYNGRPRREVMSLLLCAPSPMKFYNQSCYHIWGLVTLEPAVCNRRKQRSRLSYVGLELLDYWAGKYPKFKSFVDAYVPTKARKEIAIDAVGYKMGIQPSRFVRLRELHEKEVAMNRDTPTRRKFAQRAELQRQALFAQQQQLYWSGQTTAANHPPQWAQQAMQQAMQQQYNLANQNNVASITPLYVGGSSATDGTTAARSTLGIGSAIGRLLGRK
jgi:hypothetical protein